ncbi:prolyl endopeptidase-like isoform X3 [Scleropages formosus]|uniref:prolyl endopeptidase-like isoform X3 n=1 Tax=Scleropages formosus TaxID=113540 RepID=UPI0010FA73BD|nr:prolyl endopeptidase-like isoform X3 [Scleropages formosus]
MPSPVLLRPLPRLLRPLRSSSGCSASAAQRLSHSVREHSRSLLQKYRSQEQYFKRKLKAAYGRFPEVSDHAVVQGRHHVYFEEGGNIYRKARGQSDQELEEVLIQSEDVVRGALQRVRLSPGERMLAATLKDPKSNMVRGLLVRLGDPPASPRVLLELSDMFSFEWASDDILLFTTMKELRCQTVHRLDLREMPLKSVPVYKEQDPEFFVEVSRTRDGTLLTLNCSSRSSSEVRLVESHMPLRCPRVVQPRLPGLVYHVEHSHRHLYILANTAPGQEYQLLRTHLSSPFMRSWVPVFTPAQGTGLKDMELCRDHCILAVRTPSGTLSLQVVPLANPTKAFALQDGTLVPMTVLHTASWGNLQEAPLLLHVYGAYGLDLSMGFSPEKQVLLEEGWVLAYCHVRGGGERGLGWHQAGRLQQKHKGVEDLVACVQHLFKLGVSCPTLAALTAHSAGAILAGALCNQHPHLLRAVTLQAPFVDVLGTMQDPTLPLTIEDRGEWGDPLADSQQRDNIASYSPLQNIKPQRYPSMLITAYEGDRRIPLPGLMEYVEKLTSAVQAHGVEWPPSIILDLQPGEDHFGPEDLDTSLNEVSRQLAFLYRELGLFCGGHRQRHK